MNFGIFMDFMKSKKEKKKYAVCICSVDIFFKQLFAAFDANKLPFAKWIKMRYIKLKYAI